MISFLDGPAKGVTLMVKRAPILLRVVAIKGKKRNEWDALDQVKDVPKDDEEIFVYIRQGKPTKCHIRMSPRSLSGYYAMAEYRFYKVQPVAETLRQTGLWQTWCLGQQAEWGEPNNG